MNYVIILIVSIIVGIAIKSIFNKPKHKPVETNDTEPKPIPNLESTLKEIMDIKDDSILCPYNVYFIGGSLCIDNIFGIKCLIINIGEAKECFDFTNGKMRRPLTPKEIYYFANIYIKHKTPNHTYYEDCIEIIKNYEFSYFPIIM